MIETTALINTRKAWIPAAAIGGLLLVIFYALGVLGGPDKTEPGTTALPGQPVSDGANTFKVSSQLASNSQSWQGSIRARTVAKIASKLNGRILEIAVNPGDKVSKGEVIARLDDRELRAGAQAANAALQAAQAQATQAQTEAQRITDLYHKQAATRQNYEVILAQAQTARALANQAAAAAQQSQVTLAENVLYAPFAGVISERLKQPGDMALPNEAVVLLHKDDELRLEVAIPSHCVEQIKWGMSVAVRVDAVSETIQATLDEITPQIDPQTHTQLIKAQLPKLPGLQHGQLGWLELSCAAQQQTLLIPNTAVVHYGQLQAVKVLVDQRWQTRHIRTGKQYGEQIEVLSGLHDGDTILSHSGLMP